MGRNYYGTLSGTGGNGQGFETPAANIEARGAIVSLQGVETAALTLESAVSTSLLPSNSGTATGSIAGGWMSGTARTALSAAYSAATGSIF